MLLSSLLLLGCTKQIKKEAPPQIVFLDVDMVMPPAGTSQLSPEEIGRVIDRIEIRNRDIEDNTDWIQRAYQNLLVRRLTNVSEKEFTRYRQYLDNGAVYIIVHPGFFPFFHYPSKFPTSTPESINQLNVVEMLLQKRPTTPQFAVLQAQERRMRDFIEFKSTQEKLIIVVTPRDYKEYSGYTYRREMDEYMRYLNEITNFSESVLFVESRSPNRGYLTDDDAQRLIEFLLSVNAKKVYVGGGYVGRCLEDFYSVLTEEYGTEGIYVVPELSDVSPFEINGSISMKLLRDDGSIDEKVATQMLLNDTYRVQETIPKIENLP